MTSEATAGAIEEVPLSAADPGMFEACLTPEQWERFQSIARRCREFLAGRIVWNINSTADGGGVAELIRALLPVARGVGIDARWLVVNGSPQFFALTKMIHNLLHGAGADGLEAGRELYEEELRRAVPELNSLVKPSDIVIVHDPQPAGLVPELRRRGATVIWRSHVGVDHPNDAVRSAWRFLLPYVSAANATIFSRATYRWDGLSPETSYVIPPAIDPFTPKNQELDPAAVASIARVIGLTGSGLDDQAGSQATFRRGDGSEDHVTRPARITQLERLPESAPMVLQVSRWDRLKDPVGVLEGFASHVPSRLGAHLVLAGPAAVTDDPESAQVLGGVEARWRELPPEAKGRTHLVSLPMDDGEENAAMVNALQRKATVVVQKSLVEGFGLTVSEAMWKSRPVVASRVGGIEDQIEDGRSGCLLDDPRDLKQFGRLVTELLEAPELRDRLGAAARSRVQSDFLTPRELTQWADLIEKVL